MRYFIGTLAVVGLIAATGCETYDNGVGTSSTPTETSPADDARNGGDGTHDGGAGDGGAGDDRRQITEEEVRVETAEAVEAAREFARQEQEQFRADVAARLDKVQGHIDALKQQLERTTPSERNAELNELFRRMEQQLADVRGQVSRQKAETREAWTEMKSAVEQAVSELEVSTEDVRKQIERDADPPDAKEQPTDGQPTEEQPTEDESSGGQDAGGGDAPVPGSEDGSADESNDDTTD